MLERSSFIPVGIVVFSLLGAATASADPYCDKIHARSAADAALLLGPQLRLQGIKFPTNGISDAGPTAGNGYQFRAELSWSFIDFYKGLRTLGTGELACRQHSREQKLDMLITSGDNFGKLPALRRLAASLAAGKALREEIVERAEQRLAAHVTPLLETNEVRERASDLDKRASEVEAEIRKLEAAGLDDLDPSALASADDVVRSVMATERAFAHIRGLDAWDFGVTGGVVPMPDVVDYYGVVHVGFNFGGIGRYIHEARYLKAREAELRSARYELSDKTTRFRLQIASAAKQARQTLAVISKHATALTNARDALKASEAPQTPHALAIVELELAGLEAEKAYLGALVESLGQVDRHG